MMVLDTNVVSELMRAAPESAVLNWLDAQPSSELWLTAVVAAELMFGVARLPEGGRKQQLAHNVAAMLEQDFAGQVLAYDLAAASIYAELVAQRERTGRPIAMADAQIAAICLAHGASLVTRNEKDFDGLGLMVINPWNR
ncbi:MAG: type II toxin-antitoxin system VapC family toxin [Betaproteobacteria bacterium]|nr:type II toxin-antitoxin system VapC family toxin [Betaproteobacteria bacterium]MBP6647387.1 type II toxin-antitoxin system VapC family toxin [Burkholderiaceae bacterium]